MSAIFIEWDEEIYEFVEWNYVGNGAAEPVLRRKIVTRRARYSNTVNDEMLQRAADYVKESRPNARVVTEE